MFKSVRFSLAVPLLVTLLAGAFAGDVWAQSRTTTIKYALGDVVSVDELPLLVAVERASGGAWTVEVTAFKSEGSGDPSRDQRPGRHRAGNAVCRHPEGATFRPVLYQMSALQFFPS